MNNEKSEKKLKKGQKPEGWKNDCPKFKEYLGTLPVSENQELTSFVSKEVKYVRQSSVLILPRGNMCQTSL